MNKFKKIFLVLVALGLVGVGLAGWVLSSMVLHPRVKCRPDHYIHCHDPAVMGLPFEDVRFSASDGLKTSGWLVAPGDPGNAEKTAGPSFSGPPRVVIFVHGHGGSRNEGLRYVPALSRAGVYSLLFDLRGIHEQATMGYAEVRDVKGAISFVREKLATDRIGLLGFSMGGATVLRTSARDDRVRAAISSSAFASAVDVLVEAGRRDFSLPRFPLVDFGIWLADIRGGMELARVRPEEDIARIEIPLLLAHCERDPYVEFSHFQRLRGAAPSQTLFYVADCDKHARVWNSDPGAVDAMVTQFFLKNL